MRRKPAADVARRGALVRLAVLAGVLTVLAVAALSSGVDAATVGRWVDGTGWLAPIVFVALYAGLTVALVPGAVLTGAAGLLFGPVAGTVLAVVGASVGANVAFGLSRRTGRSAVARLESRQVARVDRWLGDRGLLAVLTLRLVPIVPFSAANYAAGLTAVRLRDFALGTILGIIPGTVAFTLLGANATDPAAPAFLAAVAGLGLLSVGGAVVLRRWDRARPGDEPA